MTCEVVGNHFRKADIPLRLGDEEFPILMPHTDEAGTQIAAEKVREVIQGKAIRSQEIILPASELPSGWMTKRLQVFTRADDALYKAKSSGRNRVAVYSSVDGLSADSVRH